MQSVQSESGWMAFTTFMIVITSSITSSTTTIIIITFIVNIITMSARFPRSRRQGGPGDK